MGVDCCYLKIHWIQIIYIIPQYVFFFDWRVNNLMMGNSLIHEIVIIVEWVIIERSTS